MSQCIELSTCPPVPKHYEELKCTPVLHDGETCASHYDCPNLSANDPEKCYINGQIFSRGDKIPSDVTGNPCKTCMCDR